MGIKLHRKGIALDRNERIKEDENLTMIENEFEVVKQTNESALNYVADQAYAQVVDAAKLDWQAPVNSAAELATVYPNALVGYTVMAKDTGIVHRYDGASWGEIQQIDAGPVNELDTRLTGKLAEKATKTEINQVQNQIGSIATDNTDGLKDNELILMRVNTEGETFKSANGRVDNIERAFAGLTSVSNAQRSPVNLFDGSVVYGTINSTTGAHENTTNTAYLSTGFVSVDGTRDVFTNWIDITTLTSGINGLVFYDENQVFSAYVESTTNKITPPTNARYARRILKHSTFSSDIRSFVIYQDAEIVPLYNVDNVYASLGVSDNAVNLFDGTTAQGSLNGTTGALGSTTDPVRKATDFIPINNTKDIFTNWLDVSNTTSGILTAYYYDAAKTFIGTQLNASNRMKPLVNSVYFRINLSTSTLSTDLTEFEVYQETETKTKLADDVTSILELTETPVNLFAGSIVQGNVNTTTGILENATAEDRTSTPFYPITPTKEIITNWIDVSNTTAGSVTLVFYDANKVFLSSVTSATGIVKPPANARYLKHNLSTPTLQTDLNAYVIHQDVETVSNTIDEILRKVEEKFDVKIDKKNVVRASDFVDGVLTDSEAIAEALSFASIFKERTIIFDQKDWYIDEAILLPANTTVIVDDCMIKQNDEVFDNVFRGDNLEINPADPNGFPLSVSPISNIRILGLKGAKIEGCDVNKTGTHPTLGVQPMVGDYWGWRTLQVSLSLADNFEVAGIEFTKTRCYALSFDKCHGGHIHHLNIYSTVRNGDGVDLRTGCYDITIEEIGGSTSDDSVALNAGYNSTITSYPTGNYVYPMEPTRFMNAGMNIRDLDIHDIAVAEIHTNGNHHGVICLTQGGTRVYNIAIDSIIEPDANGTREAVVKIYTGYGSVYNDNDLNSIRVNNVVSKSADYAVMVNTKVDDVWFNKIVQEDTGGAVSNISNMDGIKITNS